jgi:hypothetical protein
MVRPYAFVGVICLSNFSVVLNPVIDCNVGRLSISHTQTLKLPLCFSYWSLLLNFTFCRPLVTIYTTNINIKTLDFAQQYLCISCNSHKKGRLFFKLHFSVVLCNEQGVCSL